LTLETEITVDEFIDIIQGRRDADLINLAERSLGNTNSQANKWFRAYRMWTERGFNQRLMTVGKICSEKEYGYWLIIRFLTEYEQTGGINATTANEIRQHGALPRNKAPNVLDFAIAGRRMLTAIQSACPLFSEEPIIEQAKAALQIARV
jgi:hypothetical protein